MCCYKVYTVDYDRKDLQTNKTILFDAYVLTPLDIYNGSSQVYLEESIGIQ